MNHALAEAVTRNRCMKSQGEIEAAVCDGISRFQQEFIGRGPRDIHSHLLGDLLVVRLQGVLTPAERQLISPRGEPSVRLAMLAALALATGTARVTWATMATVGPC
jgi:hypothetical protein